MKEITKIPNIFTSFVQCRSLKKKVSNKKKFFPSRKEKSTYSFYTTYIIKMKQMGKGMHGVAKKIWKKFRKQLVCQFVNRAWKQRREKWMVVMGEIEDSKPRTELLKNNLQKWLNLTSKIHFRLISLHLQQFHIINEFQVTTLHILSIILSFHVWKLHERVSDSWGH